MIQCHFQKSVANHLPTLTCVLSLSLSLCLCLSLRSPTLGNKPLCYELPSGEAHVAFH